MTSFRKPLPAIALVLGAFAFMTMVEVAGAAHPRPQGAASLRVPLAIAYEQCTEPNLTHGESLDYPSCGPPAQSSGFLTVGTPDAGGADANSVGAVLIKHSAGDVFFAASVSDVRCQPATSASVCTGANAVGGPDYSGELQHNATVRLSDHWNGPDVNEAATVIDIPFPVDIPCASTPDPDVGSTCSIDSSWRPLIGIPEPSAPQRAVVELGRIEVFDGGADGDVASNDNTLFMTQGIFVP